MNTFNNLIKENSQNIIQIIKSYENIILLTFEIKTLVTPNEFAVYIKINNQDILKFFECTFNFPKVNSQLCDRKYFDKFGNIIDSVIIRKLIPIDKSKIFRIQMVRDNWHITGDFI